MPLLKLWNLLRGRCRPIEKQQASLTPNRSKEPSRSSSKGPRLSIFGGGGPHSGLRKLVKPLTADTVLEVSVGDGSRAIEILRTLGNVQEVRYIAIDQFEMVGGELTLKAFHQALRGEGIRPQVFPEPINRGLARVSHTVGAIDLIVMGLEAGIWQNPETLSLLNRISHRETVILFQDDETWDRFDLQAATEGRRAA